MKTPARKITAVVAGVSLLALAASPLMAGGDHGALNNAPSATTDDAGSMNGNWGGQMGMMGGGMMSGGMMSGGMTGYAMMGGMMPAVMTGTMSGSVDCPFNATVSGDLNLTAADVRTNLESGLKWHGNSRLKVGAVVENDDNSITAEIVTLDDSLVQRMVIDSHTGQMRPVE